MPENPNDRPLPGREILATPVLNGNDFFARKCTRLEAQISSLKEVSSIRQNLLDIRSREVKNLIEKLKLFEEAIGAERQYRESLSTRMKVAEEKCAELTGSLSSNTENLSLIKSNYEEKINQLARELEKSDADNQKRIDELNDSELRNIDLNSRVEQYTKMIHDHEKNVKQLKEELRVVAERNQVFSYQMNLLNTLFNETEGIPIDFDRIRAIGDIVRESQNMPIVPPVPPVTNPEPEGSSSPDDDCPASGSSRRGSIDFDTIMDQIDTDKHTGEIPGEESCYKQVSTMHGPQLVLSVSQTFIKLKDLILEKKSLQREIDSLKNLNTKLESKVDRQERRLYQVTSELNKTWNLVAKLKQQHNKLHNSEAVLKYELHEKRKLLEKLKEELSFSRQQWVQVRQKHRESEILCQTMRADFARRRQASSQESGAFSDVSGSPCSFSNEDPEQDEEPEIQLAMQNCEEEEEEEMDDDEDETEAIELENDYEMEIVPLEELVSDLVEEIEAVTAAAEDSPITEEETQDVAFGNTNRASRLRRLEDASRILYSRLMATTVQSSALASRLAQLHNHYGSHDLPIQGIAEPFEYDETTVNTESSTDPAYASVNNTSNTAADDTEVDSQFEDTAPNLRNSQALNGSVEMIHEDLLAETIETIPLAFSEALIVETDDNLLQPQSLLTTTAPAAVGTVSTSATTPLVEDFDDQADEGRDSSGLSSPDPNSLSRLIIQQVPKRLEMLKQQNSTMKNKEQLLMEEVKHTKELLETLEQEKALLAATLEENRKSRDVEIQTLNDKISQLISTTSRDKENITAFVSAYVEQQSGANVPTSSQDSSKCHSCTRKFSIFTRRKQKCSICLKKFCQDCCKVVNGAHRSSRGAKRMCTSCHDRSILLETTAKIFTSSASTQQ